MVTIISGGQSGVDRAALDAAIAMGLSYAGWCPKGGWAEDLPEPPGLLATYQGLRETPSPDPAQRTSWNVRDSDALLTLVDGSGIAVSQGTTLALRCAARAGKPHAVMDLEGERVAPRITTWIVENASTAKLCIGGPRESEAPGIYAKARAILLVAFASR